MSQPIIATRGCVKHVCGILLVLGCLSLNSMYVLFVCSVIPLSLSVILVCPLENSSALVSSF